jgi:nucleotide-binding universal stress UspA family protein
LARFEFFAKMETMMTKHKVLLPLDGSEFGRQIVQVVRQYLKPDKNELVLLRVAIPLLMPETAMTPMSARTGSPSRYVWTAQEREMHRAEIQQELEKEAAVLRAVGYQTTTEVLFGEPAQEICDFVKSANINLVAMTTHGRTGLRRLVLGSVAESVLRTVNVPVLLWRPVS